MSTSRNQVEIEEIITRIKNGEDAAFIDFINDNWDKVFARAFALLKNKEDAEEITQDTFIRAKSGMEAFRGECSSATWLHRIVTNLARNRFWYWWRRKRAESMSIDAKISEDSDLTFADQIVCDNPIPSENALTSEFSDLLPKALNTLDEKHSKVLIMRTQDGMSYEEIANELGITVGTVKSRLSRAREQLKIALLGSQ